MTVVSWAEIIASESTRSLSHVYQLESAKRRRQHTSDGRLNLPASFFSLLMAAVAG